MRKRGVGVQCRGFVNFLARRRSGELHSAMERGVDAVVHTGAILDHEVDQATLDATKMFLSALSALEIPVYCIIGSHDHDSANPQHPDSIDEIAWLKAQVTKSYLTELSASPTPVAGVPVDAYGIFAKNVGSTMSGRSARVSGYHPISRSGQRRRGRTCYVFTMG